MQTGALGAAEARNRMAELQIRPAYIDSFLQCILYKNPKHNADGNKHSLLRDVRTTLKIVYNHAIRAGVFQKLIASKAFPPSQGETHYHHQQQKHR